MSFIHNLGCVANPVNVIKYVGDMGVIARFSETERTFRERYEKTGFIPQHDCDKVRDYNNARFDSRLYQWAAEDLADSFNQKLERVSNKISDLTEVAFDNLAHILGLHRAGFRFL